MDDDVVTKVTEINSDSECCSFRSLIYKNFAFNYYAKRELQFGTNG